jgi:tetratricopeptide (TPR) repeat protein
MIKLGRPTKQMPRKTSKKRAKTKTSGKRPAHIRKGRIVEAVVAWLHEMPGVKVETNVELPPKQGDPERRREIDVMLTGQVAGYEVRIPFSCKNEALPIKPSLIDEFIGTLDDVGIPCEHGIFVCVNGYTKGALDRAKAKGIKTLILQGLTKDRLTSEISKALQFNVYLLADVTSITITNKVATTKHGAEFLVFCNQNKQLCGTVFDLIFDRWQKGEPPSVIGEYEFDLDVPKGWHQFVAGEAVQVLGARCAVKITGLVIEIAGKAQHHSLIDPVNNFAERSRIAVSFDTPEKGAALPVTAFSSESDLTGFLKRDSLVQLVSRIRLPRILCGNIYYPFSERVGRLMMASMREAEPPPISFTGIEGTDLKTAFEKPWYPFFKLGAPVLAMDSSGETFDVRLLMEAGDFAKVVSLESEFRKNPTQEFAHLLGWAHLIQVQEIISKAHSLTKAARERQLRLAAKKLESAITINPSIVEAYKTLGSVFRDLGRLRESVAAYDAAIALDETDFEAWADRTAPLINQNRLEEAIESASRAVEHANDSRRKSYALGTRAAAHHFAGKSREAVEDLLNAWHHDPTLIIESFGAYGIYDPICVAEPSPQGILLLAEMRWAQGTHFISEKKLEKAHKSAELAAQTLEILTTVDNDQKNVTQGTLSNDLIDNTLVRIAKRLVDSGQEEFVRANVSRIQKWVLGIRGEELDLPSL